MYNIVIIISTPNYNRHYIKLRISLFVYHVTLSAMLIYKTAIALESDYVWNPCTLDQLNPPKVALNSEVFGIGNVTVILELANDQESSVTHSVTTDPQAQTMLIGNTMAQLVLQYNTRYNVTVVASHRCSRNETVVELYFSKSNEIYSQSTVLVTINKYYKSGRYLT